MMCSSSVHVSVVIEESSEKAGLSLCLVNVGRSDVQTHVGTDLLQYAGCQERPSNRYMAH